MNIIGPDYLVFGVDDMSACQQMLKDYGAIVKEESEEGGTYVALDGTGVILRHHDDPQLPPAVAPAPNARETIYGVADQETLDAIKAELGKDRDVAERDGVIHSVDDDGYPIGFQITVRHAIDMPHYGINVPGQAPGRAPNVVAAIEDQHIRPLSLSHVVFFTQDKYKSEKFYAERLGFRTVDVFTNLGPFMRPAGTLDHHTLFLIQAPKLGLQHFTFHFAGANEILKAGFELVNKGYSSMWGPGRHVLGSNYFWYFNSPFGGLLEMDADMDLHDDDWKPRFMDATKESSQTFLMKYTEKWSPGGKH
ncbi:VOC family protein [Alteromonas sp. NFXS44]|uniref:VOC family protein n=1 Tax=Alteromonas sp. NFXS44 TaxID=2818435 RepID=UPI0032DFC63E